MLWTGSTQPHRAYLYFGVICSFSLNNLTVELCVGALECPFVWMMGTVISFMMAMAMGLRWKPTQSTIRTCRSPQTIDHEHHNEPALRDGSNFIKV